LLADLTRALEQDAPFATRIERLYARLGALSLRELQTVQLVVREALVSSTRFGRILERVQRGHVPLVLGALADGMDEGVVDTSHHPMVLVVTTFAVGALPQIMRRVAGERLGLSGLPEGDAFARELVSVLLGGIGGGAAARVSEPTAPAKAPPARPKSRKASRDRG
jgi:hypothetical protein